MTRFWVGVILLVSILPIGLGVVFISDLLGCHNPLEQGCVTTWLGIVGGLGTIGAWVGFITLPIGVVLALVRVGKIVLRKVTSNQ